LGDLFGSGPAAPAVPAATLQPVLDTLVPMSSAAAPEAKSYTCYSKNEFTITLTPSRESAVVTQILVTFTSTANIGNISFLVAVPKVFVITSL
jgi:hypothetical protein